MSEYRVEKDRFSVKLFFANGTAEDGNIYLSLRAAHHEGRESVRDVLNQPEPFLPINFLRGPTQLINKEHLMMISFPLEEEQGESVDLPSSLYEVAIHLTSNMRLEGKFIFLLPSHSSRVKDYLNQEEPFVELRKDGEVYLINRKHIIFVEEK